MEFQSRLWKVFLFSLLATGVVYADAFAGCEGLLKYGIYDIDENASRTDRAASFREWFCRRELTAGADAVAVLNSVSVPVEVVPVKLGAQYTDSDFIQSYSEFCSDTNINSSLNQDLADNLQKINPKLVKAFNACMSANGLHAWIKQTKDPGKFFLKFLYRDPKINPKPATVITITRLNAKCDDLYLPFDIAGAEKSFICTRIDTNIQSTLWIIASEPVVEGSSYHVGKTTFTP